MHIRVMGLLALLVGSACGHGRPAAPVASAAATSRPPSAEIARLERGPWKIVETTLDGETKTGGDQGVLVVRGDRFLVVEPDGKIDDHGKLDRLDDGRLSLRSNDVLMEMAMRVQSDSQIVLEGRATMKVGGQGDIRMVLAPAVPPPPTYRPKTLLEAAQLGDVEVIEQMIATKADVNEAEGGVTPLMKAAAFGHASAVKALLAAGAHTDQRGPSGSTALLLAVDGDPETVELLLAHGADVQVLDGDKNSPLKLALVYGSVPIAKALIKAGADPHEGESEGRSLLFLAVAGNGLPPKETPDMVALLLAQKLDPNTKRMFGRTPLMDAASGGYVRTTQLLLAAGADPNLHDEETQSALDRAKEFPAVKAVLLPVTKGGLVKASAGQAK